MVFIRCLTMIAASTFFILSNTYAGTNPINWSQSGSVPAQTQLNQSYAVTFILTNTLPFTMPTPIYIVNNSSSSSEITITDDCSGKKLASKRTCSVGLTLIPKTAGTKTLSVYMEYGANKIQIPKTPITTETLSGANSQIQVRVNVGFPNAILSNSAYPIQMTFTNTGSALSGLSLSEAAGTSAGYTQTNTTCGSTLGTTSPTNSCTITGTFATSSSSGAVTVGLTLGSSSVSGTGTTSSVISSSANAVRSFTFVNNCSQDVWFGFVGGAVSDAGCTSDAQCSQGSLCDPSANAGNGECFYTNPVPTGGSYQLTANGGVGGEITVPVVDYGLQYVWSGNMAARTGTNCATGTCDTGDCQSDGGDNGCPVGVDFQQPATLAEITMQRATIDSYDVSIINGLNVGVEMTPTTAYSFTETGIDSYSCQSPGNPSATTDLPSGHNLGACNWSGFGSLLSAHVTYPTSDYSVYVYVKPDPHNISCTAATQTANCTNVGYTTCGLSFDSSNTTLNEVCGAFLGYLTGNQVCSFANTNINPNPPADLANPGDAYFNCDSALSGDLTDFTYWALYACKAQSNGDLGTCYNTAANPPESNSDCCGCVNWQNATGPDGGAIAVPSSTTTCVATNTQWTQTTGLPGVYDSISWLKEACPTVYVYPYDDKASGFQCMDISGSHTVNTVDYTITFCPT